MSTTTANPKAKRGSVRVETGSKRIVAYLGGEVVADTTTPLLVWERPYYPTYYFPLADVRADSLQADDALPAVRSPSRGDGRRFSVRAGDKLAPGAAVRHEHSPFEELRDAIRIEWDAMDAWFEEDEEVFTHPRDPHTRIDVLPSSRHVRIEIDGVTVAESSNPTLLFETGLPVRYYLPKTHVRLDLLAHTDSESHCPYKGQAEYWSVRTGDALHEDVAWSYPTPLPESLGVAGHIAFYDEKVDVFVDGVRQERPHTKFS